MIAGHARIDGHRVEILAAALTAAVSLVVIQSRAGEKWLEVGSGLWKAVNGTIDKWRPDFSGPAVQRYPGPNPS
jgi:hypothetical protein